MTRPPIRIRSASGCSDRSGTMGYPRIENLICTILAPSSALLTAWCDEFGQLDVPSLPVALIFYSHGAHVWKQTIAVNTGLP